MAKNEAVTGPGSEDEESFRLSMKRMREERGWTQAELANRMTDSGWSGMYQMTIGRMEKGVRPIRIGEARGLAKVFGVTVGMMIAPSESSRPIEELKDTVLKLDALKSSLRSSMEDYWNISGSVLPEEIEQAESSGYEEWADADMRESIKLYLARAKRHWATTVDEVVDEVMGDGDIGRSVSAQCATVVGA